jgi:hypothetical protein
VARQFVTLLAQATRAKAKAWTTIRTYAAFAMLRQSVGKAIVTFKTALTKDACISTARLKATQTTARQKVLRNAARKWARFYMTPFLNWLVYLVTWCGLHMRLLLFLFLFLVFVNDSANNRYT